MKKRCFPLLLALLLLAACGAPEQLPPSPPAGTPVEEDVPTSPEDAPTSPEDVPAAPEERFPMTAEVEALLAEMTLEEKVGQLFFLRCTAFSRQTEIIRTYHPGGVLLFTSDYRDDAGEWLTRDALTDRLAQFQSASAVPLFIGSDEEGGTVTRASRNPNLFGAKFPSPQELYKAGGMKGLLTDTLQYNDALRALGVNVNFAPVCDVTSGEGQFLYERSFGQGAAETADYVSQVVGVMNAAGIGATLKHFPGYGDNVDTHTGVAVDDRPFSRFEQEDFLPFSAGIGAGAPFVMVSHNVVRCMDDALPASLSPVVHGVLRGTLGFEGVILTDDLDMGAVKAYADSGRIARLALAAGNDMIVCSDLSQIDDLIAAVREGEIAESEIDEHCARILCVKAALGLLEG